VSNGGFWYMADALAKGASFPELILVGADEHAPLVLLEGHVRLTAYFLQPVAYRHHCPSSSGTRRVW
jgi:hypothetical protein